MSVKNRPLPEGSCLNWSIFSLGQVLPFYILFLSDGAKSCSTSQVFQTEKIRFRARHSQMFRSFWNWISQQMNQINVNYLIGTKQDEQLSPHFQDLTPYWDKRGRRKKSEFELLRWLLSSKMFILSFIFHQNVEDLRGDDVTDKAFTCYVGSQGSIPEYPLVSYFTQLVFTRT